MSIVDFLMLNTGVALGLIFLLGFFAFLAIRLYFIIITKIHGEDYFIDIDESNLIDNELIKNQNNKNKQKL